MFNGHNVFLIGAADEKNGIGKNNTLVWDLKKDLKHFSSITGKTKDPNKQHMVIMGQRTWESLPDAFRPLPRRKNVVLTMDEAYEAVGGNVAHSFEEALAVADDSIETIFVIGGAMVYHHTITHPAVDGVYLTRIHHTYDCDVFFPDIPTHFSHVETLGSDEETSVKFDYLLYTRA